MSPTRLLLALALAGCREPAEVRHAPRERAASMSVEALPTAPVAGHLGGRPFALRAAWYRVLRRPGHERVDLVLSEGTPSRLCNPRTPADARQVLVRFTGVTSVAHGEIRIDPAPGATVTALYEARGEREFLGVGGGSALLALDASGVGVLAGRLRACFPDAQGSCVAGAFRAEECRAETDFDGPRGGLDRAPGEPHR